MSELVVSDKITYNDEATLAETKNKGFNHAGKLSEEVVMANPNPNPNSNQLMHGSKDQDFPALCDAEIDSAGFDFQDFNASENDEFSEFPEVDWGHESMAEGKAEMLSPLV